MHSFLYVFLPIIKKTFFLVLFCGKLGLNLNLSAFSLSENNGDGMNREKWFHIMMPECNVSGIYMRDVLLMMKKLIPSVQFLALYGIEGGGKSIYKLNRENDILPVTDVIDICQDVNQFDWGDFVFLESIDKKKLSSDLPDIIASSLGCIRIIDGYSIEIYVGKYRLAYKICQFIPNAKIYEGYLDEFTYPC